MKNWIENLKTAWDYHYKGQSDKEKLEQALGDSKRYNKILEKQLEEKSDATARDNLFKLGQELIKDCEDYKDQSAKLSARVTCYREEVKKLKAKLRAQNEADLYLLSAQIQKRIMNKETIKPDDGQVLAQAALMNDLGMRGQQILRPCNLLHGI